VPTAFPEVNLENY